MSNELTTISIKNYISSPAIAKYIEDVLHERKSSFIAALTSLVNKNDKLKQCDKSTVLMAAITSVGMNLSFDPNLGFAYLIPYGDQCQFQLGVKGLTQLCMRTNQYANINSKEIREGELVGLDSLGDPIIRFLPITERGFKPIIGYMGGFILNSGYRKLVFWTTEEIKKHASTYSQGYKAFMKNGASQSTARSGNMENPWSSNFDGMAKKTVLKNAIKNWGPMSIEIENAIRYDQAVIGIDDNMAEIVTYADNPTDITNSSSSLSKSNQELLLKNYSPELLKEALFNEELQDITELSDSDMDTFIGTCEKIKKDNIAASGEKPIESKQIELK